jgi:hypothetical protein
VNVYYMFFDFSFTYHKQIGVNDILQ